MPTYEYTCEEHGNFTSIRRIAHRDEPFPCPVCGEAAKRVVICMPALPSLSSTERKAHMINERSAHEPRLSRSGHGAGCSCCGDDGRKSDAVTGSDGSRSFPSRRPWMISH